MCRWSEYWYTTAGEDPETKVRWDALACFGCVSVRLHAAREAAEKARKAAREAEEAEAKKLIAEERAMWRAERKAAREAAAAESANG